MNPNVSDSITTAESLSHYADQVDTAENVVVVALLPLLPTINKSDSVSSSESFSPVIVISITCADTAHTAESVQLSLFTFTPGIAVSDSTSVDSSEFVDLARNNSRDIAIVDNRILDQTDDFLLDQTGDYIWDQNASERTRLSESIVFFFEPLVRGVSDTISVVESYLVHVPPSFVDTDTLTTTIKVFPMTFVLPGGIVIIMIVA